MSLWFVRACGLLIVLRSLTNFAKVFQGDDAVLVIYCIVALGTTALPAWLLRRQVA